MNARWSRLRLVTIGALAAVSAVAATDADGFTPLFNGRDLTGWRQVNVAPGTFVARDDLIVCNGVPAGFLATERVYENFVLELEWRHLKPAGNSGVLLWTSELPAPGAPFPRAIEVQVLDPAYEKGRVNAGRQFTAHGDIWPIRGASLEPVGRISENGRRSLPSEARVRPSPEWNRYRLECRDGTIRLAVNGVEVTQAREVMPRVGHLGLESEGSEIHFRHVRIKELPSASPSAVRPAPAGFRPLFNGLDFTGWHLGEPRLREVWSVRNGVISSKAGVPGPKLDLWTQATFRDFELIVDWRMPAKPAPRSRATFTPEGLYVFDEKGVQVRREILDAGDSGIFFRNAPLYQVNIWSQSMGSGDINELHKDPSLPADLRRAMLPRIPADRPFGEWNRFLIRLRGDRVSVWLNEALVIDNVPLPGIPADGRIGLQYHRDAFEFRNLFVREL